MPLDQRCYEELNRKLERKCGLGSNALTDLVRITKVDMRLLVFLRKMAWTLNKRRSLLSVELILTAQILPRGHALGFVSYLPALDKYNYSRSVRLPSQQS